MESTAEVRARRKAEEKQQKEAKKAAKLQKQPLGKKMALPASYWDLRPPLPPFIEGQHRIGVDFGGVIARMGDDWVQTPGCFEAIATLAHKYGIFIVSKAGEEMSAKTLAWLEEQGFYATTGVPRENVFFVPQRHHKADVAKKLGLTIFVDDLWAVLQHLSTVPTRFLFLPGGESKKTTGVPGTVRKVTGWDEVLRHLM